MTLDDLDELDDFWGADGAPAQSVATRCTLAPREPDWLMEMRRETPEQRRARLERQRPEREAAMAKIRELAAGWSMPGDDGNHGQDGHKRRAARRFEDPGQGERVRRQIERLRRDGLYDGPEPSGRNAVSGHTMPQPGG